MDSTTEESTSADGLEIAGRTYRSRLLTGSGKYRDFDETRRATEASGAEIVTVAIRRTNIGQDPTAPSLLDVLPPSRYTILPNTAGCYTRRRRGAHAAPRARTAGWARRSSSSRCWATRKTLFPNMPETLKAAERLVTDGLRRDGLLHRRPDPRRACSKRSAALR